MLLLLLKAMKRKRKPYKSVIMTRIFQSLRKVGVCMLALVCATSVFTVGRTNAGFFDIEESQDNQWIAGSLDGEVTYIERFNVSGMNPEENPDARVVFANVGSLDFRYNITFRQHLGSSDVLCQSLALVAKRNGSIVYTGTWADFNIQGGIFMLASLEDDTWDFSLTLPADAGSSLEKLTCVGSFDFLAWQTNSESSNEGFFDEETAAQFVVSTGEWLTPGDVIIKEVMWMGSSVSSADEWIELKNMTGKVVNLSGWKIENAASGGDGTLTIPSGKSIPANGYFLIANYGKSNSSSALNVDAQLVTTALELNNDNNGNLVLKAPTTLVVDSALGGLTDWPAGSNGALKQSMERNDIPGDGLVATNWHACVSGAANGAPYWDVTGPNFGTPLAANLSPIVMNEFVPNPVGDDDASKPDGEWIELYNILDTDIDVANWYFTNSDDEEVFVTSNNTMSGDTVVPGQGTLVVYLEAAFLDNDEDTLSLMAPGAIIEDSTDDVREDVVTYEDITDLPEGKSFARFPDGEGIWLDPEATPGEQNAMTDDERTSFRLQAYDTCFNGEELREDVAEPICSPFFLTFLGMVSDLDDDTIKSSVLL
ncbi:MAG: lamin tail domain-containing protein [Candidatus Moraniibacteriota bacterium]|nr:MAG: lamin tail domain-containing protein [Candidatus Moranbacteria bacterium]